MQPTPRLRVLSNRIPRVLVFVYFCRGLSWNMEEGPTCRVYIEILMWRAIFYHLEDSRSHGNEREAERARGQGACPGVSANHILLRGSCSTDLKCNTPSVSLHVNHEHCIKISIIMLIHKHLSWSHVIPCIPCVIKLLVWLELSDYKG